MSGRFFQKFSDSESESSEGDQEAQLLKPALAVTTAYAFSDEEEEAKRVVRSAKDKCYEELNSIIKLIRNHKKIKDISKLLTSFENLTKAFQKAKAVIEKEEKGITPRFYIRCLVELEDFVNDVWEDREGRKNMSKNNSKSLATMRQKLRKYNKDFEKEISSYRESPDEEKVSDSDSEARDSEDSDGERVNRFIKTPKAKHVDEDGIKEDTKSKFPEDEDDESTDDWDSDDTESSLSSDDGKYENLAQKFLKKDIGDDKEAKGKKERKEPKERRERKKKAEEDEGGEWEKVRGGLSSSEKPKMFAKDEEVTHGSVLKKVVEILAMRGKKRIHRTDQIEMLSELLKITEEHKLGPAMETKIIVGILAALFDYNPNMSSYLKPEMWKKCLTFSNRLLDSLIDNPDIAIGENIAEESESYVNAPFRIHGCALTLVERMDEEFTKMLQAVDAHSPDYIERLKDEKAVVSIIDRLQTYLETNQRGTSSELCRVYILKIDHLYYKFDKSVFKQKEQIAKLREEEDKENMMKENGTEIKENLTEIKEETAGEMKKENETESVETNVNGDDSTKQSNEADSTTKSNEADSTEPIQKEAETNEEKADEIIHESSLNIMDRLCKFIYAKDTTDRIRTQAILCHIYHHALHDNWFEARDLVLMSHLQHNIQKADIPLQIIYNRALVQLGLCAFRHGNIKDAHTALLDIQILGKAKELLAQGLLPRQQERTPEQEKLEKRRLLPFHKHINLELLECVYLVSAMLLEIPDVAANEYSVRKKMISRSFYNQLRKNEEQPLVGLPESMREHVVAASKAMRIGNWKACRDFIINDKMNSKVWNLFHQTDKVKEMLVQKIREESLRAYLFTYSHVYDSISLETLGQMFDLELGIVHSIISKMIINEELMASLDEPTQTLVMHRTEPSRIQGLALQLADKINLLVDQNERIWELKQMGTFGGQTGRLGFTNQNQGFRDYRQDRNNYDRSNRGDRDQRRNNQYRN